MNTQIVVILALLGTSVSSRVAMNMEMNSGVWSPNEVEMVGKALDTILASTHHISKEQKAHAEKVAVQVRANLKAVESGKLKGAERAAKVGEAIAALTGLEAEFTDRVQKAKEAEDATDAHLAQLKKELADKKGLLAKEADQMKVLTLEKDLMEKKLKLDTLMEKKQAMADKKAKEQDETETKEVFDTLAAVSQNMTSADARKAAISHLNTRVKSIQSAMANIDADEKADQAKFDSMKLDAKVGKMLKSVKKKNHREHAKAKALKSVELAHLEKAIQSVENKDAASAKDVLDKMKRDAKKLEAKSGDFLH